MKRLTISLCAVILGVVLVASAEHLTQLPKEVAYLADYLTVADLQPCLNRVTGEKRACHELMNPDTGEHYLLVFQLETGKLMAVLKAGAGSIWPKVKQPRPAIEEKPDTGGD